MLSHTAGLIIKRYGYSSIKAVFVGSSGMMVGKNPYNVAVVTGFEREWFSEVSGGDTEPLTQLFTSLATGQCLIDGLTGSRVSYCTALSM